MPAFGTASPYRKYKIEPLRPDEIRDAVEYVESLAGQAVNREAAARGHVIYLGRGLCFDCHGEDGRGDPAIGAPGLTGEAWLYAQEAATIYLHRSRTATQASARDGVVNPTQPRCARSPSTST